AAGKNHWVVRLGPRRARWVYVLIATVAYGWIAAAVLAGFLPWRALVALLPAVLSAKAARDLLRLSDRPQALGPAIQQTIAAASLHGLLLAAAIAFAGPFG
ncbi:MAG: prenyltransferase, partial [Caldimonas sp.]